MTKQKTIFKLFVAKIQINVTDFSRFSWPVNWVEGFCQHVQSYELQFCTDKNGDFVINRFSEASNSCFSVQSLFLVISL